VPALSTSGSGRDPRSELESLYRETVLEHYRRPRNRQPLTSLDASALVHNPVCGDQCRVEIRSSAGVISELAAISRGCSIAVASGSLMTEIAAGAGPDAVRVQHAALAKLLEGTDPGPVLDPRLRPFARVADLPSRRRCALLAWEALEEALQSLVR
jgi:nitrogen fixation NifU-like protein